ncbi:MAG: nicotinamide-nucleotide amidohydrolase family protein [Micrococcales bacterium]|nr:nicotinamide-nucleotide amidohydrolase family protein [Micrococcales bacterium]
MDLDVLVVRLVGRLIAVGETVATAESLTGGLVVARLIDCPGASAVVRGGIVAYASDVKVNLVGVDEGLLADGGAVQDEVARQLAAGARHRFAADWGVGTTGVAGPEPADGRPVGTVYIAVSGPRGNHSEQLALVGDRATVRAQAVAAALGALFRSIGIPH